MKILELLVENYKKVRVVEIRPDGRVVEITGRNGQGKTSVLDALWFGLKGTKALPAKKASVVRKGSERARVKIGTEDFTVTRTMGKDGAAPTLAIEMQPGKKRDKTPQDFLDDLLGALTFDPQEFATMSPAAQVEELKKTAKLDLDFEAIAAANETDYNDRTGIGRDLKRVEAQLATMNVLEGLPKEKLDEAAIVAKLNDAGEANRRAQEVFKAKQDLGAKAARLGISKMNNAAAIEALQGIIAERERQLQQAKEKLETLASDHTRLTKAHEEAEKAFQDAPVGEPVDVGALTAELQSAQRTNRAIDDRARWDELKKEERIYRSEIEKRTRAIEAREEKKREALATAEMPVKGLTFDENGVQFKGVPLENLGEGEQLRIAAEIGMAANPKLRVLCIRHGEALDDDGRKMLAELAEKRDFQLWITRVDSSGKMGVVLEDGMVMTHD